jgi:Ca2+-dependent lipid-binding protein
MSQQHTLHEPYSSRNPVPNVPRFLAEQAKKVNPADTKEDKKTKGTEHTRREVTDPTTKSEVVIQDVDADYAKAVSEPLVSPFDAKLIVADNCTPSQLSRPQCSKNPCHRRDRRAARGTSEIRNRNEGCGRVVHRADSPRISKNARRNSSSRRSP